MQSDQIDINPNNSAIPVLNESIILYLDYRNNSWLGPLSSYYDLPVTINDIQYPTVEHAIQCLRMKLLGRTKKANRILEIKTPHQARRCGDTHFSESCNDAEKELWNKNKIRIITEVISQYVAQQELVRDTLLSTGKAKLISVHQDSERGSDGNIEGEIYTCIRDLLDGRKNNSKQDPK